MLRIHTVVPLALACVALAACTTAPPAPSFSDRCATATQATPQVAAACPCLAEAVAQRGANGDKIIEYLAAPQAQKQAVAATADAATTREFTACAQRAGRG
jgi:hypothetical protein